MAYEFASRLETFPKYRKFETTFAGRPFVVETGKMCGLSNGSAMIRYGETCVLCNVTMSDKPRDGVDFFPLSVEFEEKLYAAGRIPGSFMRREGRPGEHAILSSRVVDRPIRPLFPKDMRNDVCVTMTVMSLDPDCSAEISGMNGASLAIAMSDIPWGGPIAGVFVGLVDGEIVLNPTKEQREHSDLSLTLAASEEKIVMIEAGANEVDEETMMKAIRAGHEEIKKMLAFINGIVAEIGKPKKSFTPVELDHALLADVYAKHLDEVKAAMDTDDKNVRDAALLPIMDAIAAEHPDLTAADLDLISYKLQKKVVRTWLLEDGKRVDGRGINEIRPLAAEVGLLPRVHGSGMFTRGQTQVLTICTLGSTKDAQLMDDLSDTPYKRYIHHYNFPPYSVGEARAPRSPGRREIGHGNLAERALLPVLPDENEFPYAIRVVSEVMESNGSSSMASTCGSTLALMDGGVPIKRPVSGIAMGLIQEEGKTVVLSDIQGLEDFLGDMDFKVTGTTEGITALQMDNKATGLTFDILARALQQAKEGRAFILQKMLDVIPEPRHTTRSTAPRIVSIQVPTDKIRDVIGSGGKVIRGIQDETGASVDIQEDGTVFVGGTGESVDQAVERIKLIIKVPEPGEEYTGRVVSIQPFGAFVNLLPGKDGLLHISRVAKGRVEKVEDVLNVGDEVKVVVIEVDDRGKISLDRLDKPEAPARAEGASEGDGEHFQRRERPRRERSERSDRPRRPGDNGGRKPRRHHDAE